MTCSTACSVVPGDGRRQADDVCVAGSSCLPCTQLTCFGGGGLTDRKHGSRRLGLALLLRLRLTHHQHQCDITRYMHARTHPAAMRRLTSAAHFHLSTFLMRSHGQLVAGLCLQRDRILVALQHSQHSSSKAPSTRQCTRCTICCKHAVLSATHLDADAAAVTGLRAVPLLSVHCSQWESSVFSRRRQPQAQQVSPPRGVLCARVQRRWQAC